MVHYVHTSGTCSRCTSFTIFTLSQSAFTVGGSSSFSAQRNMISYRALLSTRLQLREQMVLRRCQQLLQPWPNRLPTPCHMLNNKVMLIKQDQRCHWALSDYCYWSTYMYVIIWKKFFDTGIYIFLFYTGRATCVRGTRINYCFDYYIYMYSFT